MRLFLVRHGLAEGLGPDGTDAGRRLTTVGEKRIRAAGRGLRALGVRPDVLLTSPVTRALETAWLLGGALERPPEPLGILQTGSAPQGIVRALAPYAALGRVMLVGHEPTLSEIVALLLTGRPSGCAVRFKQGTCVALEVEALAAPWHGMLRWMMTARQLAHCARR